MLFSHWALILQLCLHFFQKLKHYTLENKDYFRKLFWVVAAINANAGEVKSTVSPLVKDQEQTLMGSMADYAETISVTGFLLMPWYG